jgi:hypothetical protein
MCPKVKWSVIKWLSDVQTDWSAIDNLISWPVIKWSLASHLITGLEIKCLRHAMSGSHFVQKLNVSGIQMSAFRILTVSLSNSILIFQVNICPTART